MGLQAERAAPMTLSRSRAESLTPNLVAVLWPGHARPLRLDPLLAYRESETADEVLFLNRDRNGRHVEYLSYTTGRTERDPAMATAMTRMLARIVGGAVDEERLAAIARGNDGAGVPDNAAAVATTPDPRGGATDVGDYQILGELGRGGMGVVYLARQLSLNRLVALKMLSADLAGDEVALARFRREMRALARSEHRNIVKILSSGVMPDGRIYYAMEYVPGCTLEQVWRELAGPNRSGQVSQLGSTTFARAVLSASRKMRALVLSRESGSRTAPTGQAVSAAGAAEPAVDAADPPRLIPPLPDLPDAQEDPGGYVRRVASLIRDAALALQSVHDGNFLHRDVKPANLMLTPDGSRVVLMDFGLVKAEGASLTVSRKDGFVGTLRYAAPEQLAAARLKIGPPADVRGLGVVLWELLTRKRLFDEAQDEAQLAALVHGRDVPRLRSIDPTLDRDLDAIVARATERDVADRIGAAGKLAEYIDLWLDAKPIPIRPPTVREFAWRWVKRNRLLSGTFAAAVILAATGLAWTTWLYMQPAQLGKLVTDPTNAFIYVDGVKHDCVTPCFVPLKPGRHVLEIRRDGYLDFRREVYAAWGRAYIDGNTPIALVPSHQVCAFESTPPGVPVEVWTNDRNAPPERKWSGKTPASQPFQPGEYRAIFLARSGERLSRAFVITGGGDSVQIRPPGQ